MKNSGEEERALILWWKMIKGWCISGAPFEGSTTPSAAACFKDYAKEDRSASQSYCNLLLEPSCSPARGDFPAAKEAFARFPLLNILQQNPTETAHILDMLRLHQQYV